jgi:murein hydrolase activator
MIVVFKGISIICLAAVFGAGLGMAETTGDAQVELKSVQDTLAQSQKNISQISTTLAESLKAQSDISDKLVVLAKRMAEQQQSVTRGAAKLANVEAQGVTLASDLALRQDQLSVLLAGLQRLQQNPPPALVVEPDRVLDAMRGAMLFGAVVPDVANQATELKDKLDELQAIRDETKDLREQQQVALSALENSRQELKALLDQKKLAAAAAAHDLETEKTKANALAEKAKSLQQLVIELQKAKIAAELKQTAEAKAAAEAAAKAEAERLAALEAPPKPISASKGQLAMPVAGDVLKRFGDDNGLGSSLDGMAIATHANVNVISPVAGKVEFAGAFRSYGQLLILNAGEGYLVLLAGMNKISAEIGQSIKAGEPVGVMGAGPSNLAFLSEEKDRTGPVFYVEFRKDNAPIDSTPWWAFGQKEAMK